MPGATSTPSAPCSTRCWPAIRRSPAARRKPSWRGSSPSPRPPSLDCARRCPATCPPQFRKRSSGFLPTASTPPEISPPRSATRHSRSHQSPEPGRRNPRSLWNPLSLAATGVALAALLGMAWLKFRPVPELPVRRLSLTTGPLGISFNRIALAPDGSGFVYTGQDTSGTVRLMFRPFGQLEAVAASRHRGRGRRRASRRTEPGLHS